MNTFTSALEQAAALREGRISSVELVELYLSRIEKLNPMLNHYWIVLAELALAQAKAADKSIANGENSLLTGIPISIKDSVSIAGHPTSSGSRGLANQVFNWDSFSVSQLRRSGACFLGKTTMPEFGNRATTEHGGHGAAINPWSRNHSTGGSSGGAAGAVVAGMCTVAHGGDGAGSIRIPASCCGCVGLKPSRGLISTGPVYGEGWFGLVTEGSLARTVADVALGLDVMSGHLNSDPYWAEREDSYVLSNPSTKKKLRIAFSTGSTDICVSPDIRRAVERVAHMCEELNHIVENTQPQTLRLRDVYEGVLAASVAGDASHIDPKLLDPLNHYLLERSSVISAGEIQQLISDSRKISRTVVAFWDKFDILITPTLTDTAPPLNTMGLNPENAWEEYLNWLAFTYPFNCTGQPAISLPIAMSDDHLPIGIQLVGAPRGEKTLLNLAAQLEEAMPWSHRYSENSTLTDIYNETEANEDLRIAAERQASEVV